MKKGYIFPLLLVLILWACEGNQNKKVNHSEPENEILDDGHSSEIALDWDGIYSGLTPCASCPGILTTVILNEDHTFTQTRFYLGEASQPSTEQGSFSFTKEGNAVVLEQNGGDKVMYAVGENCLIMLDKNGQTASSDLAYLYELSKLSNDSIVFSEEQAIKGLLVLGHEVATFSPCGSSKIYWIVNSEKTDLQKWYQKAVGTGAEPYTPVMAELILLDKGKVGDGFAEAYESVLEVKEIKKVEAISPDNYCKE